MKRVRTNVITKVRYISALLITQKHKGATNEEMYEKAKNVKEINVNQRYSEKNNTVLVDTEI